LNAHDISTRQLRAFLALCELRNFTRAADASHLSQPAFSALISALEDAVGARLFDRTTRSVQLTAEGRLFEPSARRLVAETRAALADLADHVERRKGHVHVAALPSLAAGWLPEVFASFRSNWPGIDLKLSDLLSDACINLVRGGHADFALAAAGTRGGDSADLHLQVLCSDQFHLVCRHDHPLAVTENLSLKMIAPWPFVHMARHSSVRQALEAALHPLPMNTVLEVEQLATVMGMVVAGMGISIVPALTLFQFQHESLVSRPLQVPRLRRNIYLIRRREGSLSAAAQGMWDLVMNQVGARSFR